MHSMLETGFQDVDSKPSAIPHKASTTLECFSHLFLPHTFNYSGELTSGTFLTHVLFLSF